MPRQPPVLEEERVEEILLRFPPDQPAGLFRAALVCKRWCRLISSAGFRRRYREFHRTPPQLGFLSNGLAQDGPGGGGGGGGCSNPNPNVSRFVPAAAFCCPPAEYRDARVLDARHGRILFQHVEEDDEDDLLRQRLRGPNSNLSFYRQWEEIWEPCGKYASGLFVTVPTTTVKEQQRRQREEVPVPAPELRTLAAAVLCSDTTGACDHLDCHGGPYLVVFVGYHASSGQTLIYTYSSETAEWNDPISTRPSVNAARLMPSAYVGNALYFGFGGLKSILKYDLRLGQISWIQLPSMCTYLEPNVFVTTEAGVLGLATIHRTKLYVWSRMDGPGPQVDDAGWTQTGVLDLQRVLTVQELFAGRQPHVIGFTDGIGVIFFLAYGVIHALDLQTQKVNKIHNDSTIYTLVPYMSFYTPALGAACTGEGPSAGGPSP